MAPSSTAPPAKFEPLARLAAIVESSEDVIISKDLNGVIQSWNPAAERLFGYRSDEVVGRPMILLIPPDRLAEEANILARIHVGEIVKTFETIRVAKGGGRIAVAATVSPIRDHRGRIAGASTILRDIGELKRVHQELIAACRSAEAANIAKSRFLANMSHELRTPMNAILGMTDLALGEQLPSAAREYLQTARESAELLLELLDEILDFSRIEVGRFELESAPFSLHKTVERVVKILSTQAGEKRLEFVYEISDEVPDHVGGDSLRLQQVLMNLVSNAVKFTANGRVVLRVEAQKEADTADGGHAPGAPATDSLAGSCVSHTRSSVPSAVRLRFSVSDTGIGIASENLEKIFSPFTQADVSTTRQFGGTGLGLAISQRLVALMGGRLGVESEPGKGSTFSFDIPLGLAPASSAASGAERPDPDRPRTAPPVPFRKLRVLLAEDTRTNQKLVLHVLGKRGHTVEVAENGRAALERICESDYDVVLMDVQMPELDGFRATAEVRRMGDQRKARLPIIGLTAHAMQGDREQCLAAGMDGYIAKPIDMQELVEAVERLAENSAEARPAATEP